MRRRDLIADILWTVFAGGLILSGIVLCATHQGSARTPGIRLALIGAALVLGAAGGLVASRLTRSRRRKRGSRHAGRSHRRVRTTAFIIGGIVVASTVVATYLCERTWLVVSGGLVAFALTWIWYAVETGAVNRGARPWRSGRRSSKRR